MNYRWAIVIAALVFAAAVGIFAYNAGVAQGVEQAGKVITLPGGAVQMPMYYWHRPFGFGGFFFIPLFFLALFLFAGRGRRWHHHHHACGYERYEREQPNPDR